MENDTIKLLRECDSGVKMGISSFEDVLDSIESNEFKNLILDSKSKHETLYVEIQKLLEKYNDEGKNPNPILKGASWVKTKFEIMMKDNDKTIANLMIEGANMGVKSLSKYFNECSNATEEVKNITKRLIDIEDRLAFNLRKFL